MPREGALEAEGAVVEVLPNGVYRVELANGHRLLAFVAGREKSSISRLSPGAKVRVKLSPYDLSAGRIIVERQTI